MTGPRFEVLYPPGEPASAEALCAAMRPWEHAPAGRPLVLCNMVATLDGRIAVDGGSTGLGGPGDKAMFHALRTVADAVLAGTGTLRAERYGRLVRAPERRARRSALGLEEDPIALLITRSGDLPWTAPLFDAPEQRVGIAAPAGRVRVPSHVRARVEVVELEDASAGAALRGLGETLGLRTVLCEGGPTLNRSLVEDGVLDELFLTLDPQLIGGDAALRLLAGAPLAAPAPMRLRWLLRHEDEVLLRYARG